LDFKRSLKEYLVYSIEQNEVIQTLQTHLSGKLETLYVSYDDKTINDALLLRTANRVIGYLTTENHKEPSSLFTLLISQGSPLTLVVILLKIILICRYARTHLESRIADLIQYYEKFGEQECKWVITFFEIFNVTMAIYAENVEYNLVNMTEESLRDRTTTLLDNYRIFSQWRGRFDDDDEDLGDIEQFVIDDSLEQIDSFDNYDPSFEDDHL
ncbi:MAG TPA: hypothetical protein ACFE0H_00325, partial [Elainellaceae cyanobacterium]